MNGSKAKAVCARHRQPPATAMLQPAQEKSSKIQFNNDRDQDREPGDHHKHRHPGMRGAGQKQHVATESRHHPQDDGRVDCSQDAPRCDSPPHAEGQSVPRKSQGRQHVGIGFPPKDQHPVCGKLRQELQERVLPGRGRKKIKTCRQTNRHQHQPRHPFISWHERRRYHLAARDLFFV